MATGNDEIYQLTMKISSFDVEYQKKKKKRIFDLFQLNTPEWPHNDAMMFIFVYRLDGLHLKFLTLS